MGYIYLMDTKIPVPEDYDSLPLFREICENSVVHFDQSYTDGVLAWLQEEMRKTLKRRGVFFTPIFSNLSVTFFKGIYINEPEQSFFPERNMIAIGISRGANGNESDLQRTLLHEGTHACMADPRKVGMAISEGLALLMEEWWCKSYGIRVQRSWYPPHYQFSKKLILSILANVYEGDEERLVMSLQKGKEDIFLQDMDHYSKSHHLFWNSEFFTVFSSILFWAKQDPKNLFDTYHVSASVKRLQKEMIHSFHRPSRVLLNYQGICEEISQILYEMQEQECPFAIFRATFEKELGELCQEDSQKFQSMEEILTVYHQTCDIVGCTSPSAFTKRLLR